MKKRLNLFGMVSLASIALIAMGGVVAHADETEEAESGTTVGVKDYAKSDVRVKIQVPNINQKDTLAFDDVPEIFDFGFHKIETGQKTVSSNISLSDSKLSVYKDYERDDEWQVKATVSDLTDGTNSYEVSSFALNSQELSGTAAKPVLFKSTEGNNGIGTYSYNINTADIAFKLPAGLEEGVSTLKGNVFYTLEVTKAAE